jgi:hypothetical protein
VADFAREAQGVESLRRKVGKLAPFAWAGVGAVLAIGAWLVFSWKSAPAEAIRAAPATGHNPRRSATPPVEGHVARNVTADVKIGSQIDEKGEIAGDGDEAEILAGQPVHVVTEIEGAPSNTPVTVVWYGPKDERVREETNWTQAGDKALTFHAFDTSAWKSGEYRAELWVGKNKVAQEPFKIGKGEQKE